MGFASGPTCKIAVDIVGEHPATLNVRQQVPAWRLDYFEANPIVPALALCKFACSLPFNAPEVAMNCNEALRHAGTKRLAKHLVYHAL
jgi:hypothetical protein